MEFTVYSWNKSCKRIALSWMVYRIWKWTEDDATFKEALDNAMRKQNMYYDDLIIGNILQKQWSVKWLKRLSRVYEVDRKTGRTK
jgi:hypothetical protein